jgi:hypothetical protein
MKSVRHLFFGAFCSISCVLPFFSSAQGKPEAGSERVNQKRDGQHDFDFSIGTWKTHVSRLREPLTGSTRWAEYDGVSVVREILNGHANLFELSADGPAGHLEGVGLRLYNPESHQWSLNWANGKTGILGVPTIGEFKNGRGIFVDQESFNERVILVRNSFMDITPNSARFEQTFSDDGGETWETNWVMTFTRLKPADKRPNSTANRRCGLCSTLARAVVNASPF